MNCQKIKTKIIKKNTFHNANNRTTKTTTTTTQSSEHFKHVHNHEISFQKCQSNPLTQVKLFDRNLIINK